MTDREMNMYGCTLDEIKEAVQDSHKPFMGGEEMLAMSWLSDAQELIAMGAGDRARQHINRAKYVLSERIRIIDALRQAS
jgi:hypothetical protein